MIDHKTYRGSLVSVTQNELPIADYFQTYLDTNPGVGYLTFEIYQDSPVRGRTPIPNARITVSKLLGDDYYFSKIIRADNNGETEPIALPAVSRELSLTPGGEGMVYSAYHVMVEAPDFLRQEIYNIQIFDGITSVQRVAMQRDSEAGSTQSWQVRTAKG